MGGPAERGQTFMPRKPLKGRARLPGRALRQACPETKGVRLYAPCSACANHCRKTGFLKQAAGLFAAGGNARGCYPSRLNPRDRAGSRLKGLV